MADWLNGALDYIPRWLAFQMTQTEQPGCAIAVAHKGRIVLEQAFGHADLAAATPLTPRHRFRVASHSKSFTAAAIMKLRERGKLGLDDRAGRYIGHLHPKLAQATIAQLLSHSAGIFRDGTDCGYWLGRRPFPDAAQIRADLTLAPSIEPNSRFKYSNHGFALAGLIIETVADEPYLSWMKREIVDAAGLEETRPDVPLPRGTPLAQGHSGTQPLGRRVRIPGNTPTRALASATGFVSTAADLARFFAQLSPTARRSLLSAASRREMTRVQWRDPHSSLERYYGLGTISGKLGDWEWFGHMGAFPGYITRSVALPAQELSLSVLTNATDGLAPVWLEGVIHVLRAFAKHGAPSRKLRSWTNRWWSLWGAFDLVAVGDKVLVGNPALMHPFLDASEIEVTGRDRGQISLAGGFAVHGEPVRRMRGRSGKAAELWLAGLKLVPEAKLAKEMAARYGAR